MKRYRIEKNALSYMIVDTDNSQPGITTSIGKIYDKEMADCICKILNSTSTDIITAAKESESELDPAKRTYYNGFLAGVLWGRKNS